MAGEKAWELYTQGKIADAIADALAQLAQMPAEDEEGKQSLHAILAWCYYHRKDYPQAFIEIGSAGENQRAKECLVFILAYAKGYTDDVRLLALVGQMQGNIKAANAMVIRARASDNTAIDHEQIWQMAEGFAEQADVAEHDVSLAHLLNNCARFFLDKARNRRDLKFAIGLMKLALAHYGEHSNWHHRAAAQLWLSHMFEKTSAIPEAFAASVASLMLWQTACTLEKGTKPWLDNLTSGCKRVAEMAEKLAEFAKRAKA